MYQCKIREILLNEKSPKFLYEYFLCSSVKNTKNIKNSVEIFSHKLGEVFYGLYVAKLAQNNNELLSFSIDRF